MLKEYRISHRKSTIIQNRRKLNNLLRLSESGCKKSENNLLYRRRGAPSYVIGAAHFLPPEFFTL